MSNINTIPSTRLVFTDSAGEDAESLAAGTGTGTQAIILTPTQDGVEQISSVLASRTGICSLHIVSHGSPFFLHLYSVMLRKMLTNMQVNGDYIRLPSHLMPASL
jgi:hypothetical protein